MTRGEVIRPCPGSPGKKAKNTTRLSVLVKNQLFLSDFRKFLKTHESFWNYFFWNYSFWNYLKTSETIRFFLKLFLLKLFFLKLAHLVCVVFSETIYFFWNYSFWNYPELSETNSKFLKLIFLKLIFWNCPKISENKSAKSSFWWNFQLWSTDRLFFPFTGTPRPLLQRGENPDAHTSKHWK
jgi:hypothetical protein